MQESQEPAPAEPRRQAAEKQTVTDVLQTVRIAIDTYDDIFSDFDPSPYQTRTLSVDFLKELRRRYSETPRGDFAITFTIPHPLRSERTEALVKKRVKDYFKWRLKDVEKRRAESMQKGALRLLIGIILSLLLLVFPQLDTMPALTLMSVLIWYVLWTGFEYIFEAARRLKRKQDFCEKFLKAGYSFVDEEDVVRSISSSYR